MDHAEYVYTEGMSDSEIEARLRAGDHGVLGLADDDDGYAIPLHYHYDGEWMLFRMSEHDDSSEKQRFLQTTETATFVCYEESADESWSVHIRGPLRRREKETDEALLNELFPPFHLFEEAIEDVEFVLYKLRMDTVVGRKTVE